MILEPYYQRVRSYCNGSLRFDPDFGNDAFLKSFVAMANARYENGALLPAEPGKPARVTVLLQSPYVMTKASGQADGAAALEVSTDGGKTFRPADLKDFSAAVRSAHLPGSPLAGRCDHSSST